MAKSKKQVEPRKGGRETGSKMLPGQPVQDALSEGALPTAEEPREKYSKLDHATLVQNMQAVCVELALAINKGGERFNAPPALTYRDVEDRIPLALYKIAVTAGWIEEQTELTDDEYERNKDADLFGGHLHLTASFKEWFLGLVATQLAILEQLAEDNLPKQEKFSEEYWDRCTAEFSASLASSKKNKTLQHLFDTSKRLHGVMKLARVADAAGKKMNPPVRVTHSSVSRIYNGEGNVGPDILEVVASVINQELPCARADLEPTASRQTKRPHSNRQK